MLDRLAELVVKPVDGSGGKGIVIGPRATPEELDALRRRVLDDPRGWIAQPLVQLSTVPTLIDDGLEPRHVDLRPFAVNRRRRHLGAARRADPGRPARGRAGGEQQPGRRQQGHLGAQPAVHRPPVTAEPEPAEAERGAAETEVDGHPIRSPASQPPAAPPAPRRAAPRAADGVRGAVGLMPNGRRSPSVSRSSSNSGAPVNGSTRSQQSSSSSSPAERRSREVRMLSRIAESMFWIGRYVERADDTARLLQTHLRLLVEDTSRPPRSTPAATCWP